MLRFLIFGLTCREVADFLLEYLEGDLPVHQRRAFRRHLFWCSACVAYVESYRKTVNLARALGQETPPELSEPLPEEIVRAVLAARDEHQEIG